MRYSLQPVDVISLSGADGELRPLRVRAERGFDHVIVGNVQEILRRSQNTLFGAETHTFLCRIRGQGESSVLELKYFVRSHRWYVAAEEC